MADTEKPDGIDRTVCALIYFGLALPLDVFVLWTLWKWFAVTAGLPRLSWAHVYGLHLVIVHTTSRFTTTSESRSVLFERTAYAIFAPILFLVFGFIFKGFM